MTKPFRNIKQNKNKAKQKIEMQFLWKVREQGGLSVYTAGRCSQYVTFLSKLSLKWWVSIE